MSSIRFDLAGPDDDASLRALLARNEMEGGISLSFRREPSYFLATEVQGASASVLVARDPVSRACVGVGTRALRPGFLNGRETTIGYLSDLRLDPRHRGGNLLARGYAELRRLHEDGRAPLYFSVIAEENASALDVLTSGRAGLPSYHDLGRLLSPAINLTRRRREPRTSWTIEAGTSARLDGIVECLNRNMRRRQFAPFFYASQFGPAPEDSREWPRLRDLRLEQLRVAVREDRVIGVVAHWDQRGFKQTVVTRYQGRMRLLKPWINLAAPLLGLGRLPAPGEPLRYFYASLIAIDDDDVDVLHSLLLRLYNEAVGTGAMYFLVGLHDRDPLAVALREFRRTPFHARLFAVHFADGDAAFARLDDRVPYVELGML
ncbi:MAG: hypothetical protein U0527_00350 [Candidatus Eisenbacteria bacterium]